MAVGEPQPLALDRPLFFCAPQFRQVIAFVSEHFIDASLREKQNAKMRFEFPPQAKSLAEMFGFIEVSEKTARKPGPVCFPVCFTCAFFFYGC